MLCFQQSLDQIKLVLDWQGQAENEPNEGSIVEYQRHQDARQNWQISNKYASHILEKYTHQLTLCDIIESF